MEEIPSICGVNGCPLLRQDNKLNIEPETINVFAQPKSIDTNLIFMLNLGTFIIYLLSTVFFVTLVVSIITLIISAFRKGKGTKWSLIFIAISIIGLVLAIYVTTLLTLVRGFSQF